MFFDRKKYKDFAKIQLKKRWTIPVIAALIVTIIGNLLALPDAWNQFRAIDWESILYNPTDYMTLMLSLQNSTNSFLGEMLQIVSVIVSFVLEFATIKLAIKMSQSPEPVTMGDFFAGFENAGRAILTGLYQLLFVFLWMLLFIIPGIIKAYSYWAMFYLSAEFKNISIPELMNISKKITRGHKWELFVLDLSFLGWALLSVLTLSIGDLWLRPYIFMTRTNAFHALLKDALEKGIIKPEELA